MADDFTCICGRRFEASYIEQHRKYCDVYNLDQKVWNSLKLDLDSFCVADMICLASGVCPETDVVQHTIGKMQPENQLARLYAR